MISYYSLSQCANGKVSFQLYYGPNVGKLFFIPNHCPLSNMITGKGNSILLIMQSSKHRSCAQWTTALLVPLPATLHLNDSQRVHSICNKQRYDSYSSQGFVSVAY